jgi:radical SAM protein with 4Fe4S-binding SPASM domain
MPCVGVNLPVGNIRERKLGEIIAGSDVIEDLRDHRHTIQGPCQTCKKADHCYGCRGAAYQMTGNYLASDPLCWRNIGREEEIVRLPAPVDDLIPQQPPMRIVDVITSFGERTGEMAVTVAASMPFVGEDGVLDEAAYIEIMAQSVAAMNGFRQIGSSAPSLDGLLLGVRDFEILGLARVGDYLKITVEETARYGDFHVMRGEVARDGEVLARGEIKILRIAAGSIEAAAAGGM